MFKTDNNFIDKTGKTHGIRFNIKPPKIDIRKTNNSVLFIKGILSSTETFFINLKLWFLSYNKISNGKLSLENWFNGKVKVELILFKLNE